MSSCREKNRQNLLCDTCCRPLNLPWEPQESTESWKNEMDKQEFGTHQREKAVNYLDMKSPLSTSPTLVSSCHLRIILKQRPISLLFTVETATISLKVLGTPSCLRCKLVEWSHSSRNVQPARYVEASSGDCLIGPPPQPPPVVDLLEQQAGSVQDRLRQVDPEIFHVNIFYLVVSPPVGHIAETPECVDESSLTWSHITATGPRQKEKVFVSRSFPPCHLLLLYKALPMPSKLALKRRRCG